MAEPNITSLPAEMLKEMVMGVGSQQEIAAKYGFDAAGFLKLCTYKWFNRALEEERSRMESEGFTQKARFGMMAETLLISAFTLAKNRNSVEEHLDVAKYLAKLAGLEPQPGASPAGGGFSLIINVPSAPGQPASSITLDAEVISADAAFDLPPLPPYLANLDALPIVVNQDLANGS